MKILAVDIGTGTQDILLFDTQLDVENSFKMVMPSPTMIIRERILRTARRKETILLSGVTMGGGPCAWAVEDALKAGQSIFATPDAARTLNDDLERVAALGVKLVSEDEAAHLPASVRHIELRDFDFPVIRRALANFGVSTRDLASVAVAVFDHGAAPAHISDRTFRFDYLDARIRAENRLSAFAFPASNIPPILTRLQAVARSAQDVPAPLLVMDTAPAAVLGCSFDPVVNASPRTLIANVGNFHTLAFRLGPGGIEGVFEHHTGLLNTASLETLLLALADGSLTRADVFNSNGHGALLYNPTPLDLSAPDVRLVVTGPRRSMLAGSRLTPYFATPFGDMMIAGCFGLLSAAADLLPNLREPILKALNGGGTGKPPWEAIP